MNVKDSDYSKFYPAKRCMPFTILIILINTEIEFNFYGKEINMCSVWNNTIAKEREDAVVKGKLETAEYLFFEMNISLELICNATKLTLDQVEKHLSAKKKYFC